MDTDNSTCPHCFKNFSSSSTKNRHIKTVHKLEVERKNSIIFCPLCASHENRKGMNTYDVLEQHFIDKHDLTIEKERLTFPSHEDFEKWCQLDDRNADYIIAVTAINNIWFYCNRSNYHGHKSTCSKRKEKKGGSIKIDGICPSRIKATFHCDDHVEVHYVKTHVGHEVGELRARRLTYEEQKEFADKMRAGVSLDRILEDAKKIQNGKVERRNLILRAELKYIGKKFNIEVISRDPKNVVATDIKLQEWNSDDKNYEFICTEIGAEIENEESDHFFIEEVSKEQLKLKESENEFINEKFQNLNNKENQEENVDDEARKEIMFQDFVNRMKDLKNLDITTLKKAIDTLTTTSNQFLPNTSTKRKMEKQSYYPQAQNKQRKQ